MAPILVIFLKVLPYSLLASYLFVHVLWCEGTMHSRYLLNLGLLYGLSMA